MAALEPSRLSAGVRLPPAPSGAILTALNASGDTFLAWGYYAVYSRYRTHHQAWGGRFTVSPDAGVNVLEGVLESAIAAHGDAVVMWTQEELPLKVRVRSVS